MYGHFMLLTVRNAQSLASREQPYLQVRDSALQNDCISPGSSTPSWHGGTDGQLRGWHSHWLVPVLQHLPPAQSGAGPTRRGSCSLRQPPSAVHTILFALLCPAVVHVGSVPAGNTAQWFCT